MAGIDFNDKKAVRFHVIRMVKEFGSQQAKDNPFDLADKIVNYINTGSKDKSAPKRARAPTKRTPKKNSFFGITFKKAPTD